MPNRRIVPDASVVVSAFFPETMQYRGNPFPLTKRATDLTDAIRRRSVDAVAPEHLIYEFTKVAHRKWELEGVEIEVATRSIEEFLYMWGTAVRTEPMFGLAEKAWELSTQKENKISPPDSWYLACAIANDAELWIATDEDKDHFATHAKVIYKEVYVLTEMRFHEVQE